MKTNDCAAAESYKLLIVLFDGRPADAIGRLTEAARQVQAHVLVAVPGNQIPPGLTGQEPNLHVLDPDHTPGTGLVQQAIQAARRLAVTHILTLDPLRDLSPRDLVAITTAMDDNPNTMIVGKPMPYGHGVDPKIPWRRKWGNFCYRLQTGRPLDYARSGVYGLALDIFESLPLSSRPGLFRIQAPVKAAWAGIDVKQVALAGFHDSAIEQGNGRTALGESILQGMMTLHLTMRAITPLPHRKIAEAPQKPGRKVSVIHPLRSIKTLLTENATPWQLCLAAAMGVFLGALPLIAVHTIAILFAAGYFRLNKVAALAASQLCMPPIVPALCIELGYYLRYGSFLTEISLKTLGYQAVDRLYEWLIGSLLLGPLLAALTGAVVYFLAISIRRNLELQYPKSKRIKNDK